MADPHGEVEQRAEAILAHRVALDIAADVADDPAEPGAQEGHHPTGQIELMGVDVAAVHDGGPLGDAPVALAQYDALALGEVDQLLEDRKSVV